MRVSQAFVREERDQRLVPDHGAPLPRRPAAHAGAPGDLLPVRRLPRHLRRRDRARLGSVLVHDGTITAGTVIAFLLYLDLFFAPIQQLSQVFDP